MKNFLFLIVLGFITTFASAQNNYQDVVYLKNGSIIRGTIIEQVPGKSIKIETADKSVFVYKMDEIEKLTKEENIAIKGKQYSGKKRGCIGLSVGANIPVGKFADENDGAAKTGFQINLINFGYLFSDNIGITATWFGASNPIVDGGSDYLWSHGGLLVGPLFSFPVSEKIEWDVKPMVGLSWASITNTNLEMASSFAFSLGTGFRFNVSRLIALTLGVDYITAKFKWDIGDQSMGTLGIKGGFAFRLK
jgi:hypothetical protein